MRLEFAFGSFCKTDGLVDDRLSKIKMLAIKGLPQPDLQNALKISEENDVIIAAVGENLYLCGEGRERKRIKLPGEQKAFVEQLIATGKPVILVMFGGRQQPFEKFEGKCAAILQAWFLGEKGGNALSDIIVGNVNPSAKLCVTYPKFGEKQEINYKKGYNANNLPQYPFAYGLSYTNYKYSDIVSQANADINDDRVNISCKLKNTSEMDGTEIVQLYMSPKDANSIMMPIQLKGFQRVELKVGEEKQVTFKFPPEQLAQFKNSQWIIEGGKYEFKIGSSCTDIHLSQEVEIKGSNRVLENGRNVFFSINE